MTERDLAASLRADQRERWRRGERVPVEAYLEREGALRTDPEGVLDLIYNEVVLREEAGDVPQLGEYLARFPQFPSELRIQFEVHRALEADSATSNSSVPAGGAFLSRGGPTGAIAPERVAIPGYEILGELGRGGMGIVYLARQVALKRRVALKMILAGPHADPKELARFRTEAEAVARLQHPNVVQIYEVIDDRDGRPCFSLELIEGGSLARLDGAPQPPRRAGELVETLARAMEYVHKHGIIHRDLKPSNVLLTAEGVAKITDFGLAKLLDSQDGQTPSEAFLGTPSYMSPEQASGRPREIGPASDVYALGAILYELLTGRPPFRGETPLDTVLMVVSEEPVPPSRLQPKVSRDLETICLKCLEKEPRHRYPGAGELADDLGRFLAGEPIVGRPISAVQRGVKWARRRPAAASLLGVATLAVLTSIVLGWRSHAIEERRLGGLRTRGQELVFRGQAALSEGKWEDARLKLSEVLTRIGPEHSLADIADQAKRLLGEAQRKLDEEASRQMARVKRQEFDRWREEVLIRGARPVDEDAAANLRETESAAQGALAAVGMISDPEATSPALDPLFGGGEKGEILASCYEMLLLLADAEAQRLPRQTPEDHHDRVARALRILDRAARLGPATRAYHLRRSRYLALLGDATAAEQEHARAQALTPAGATDSFLLGIDSFLGDEEHPTRGDKVGATRQFDQALRLRPDHFWARYYLAVCYLNSAQPDLAEVCLTACLGQRPDILWVYILRGFARGELRDFQGSEVDFQKASELKPNADARNAIFINRGAIRLEQGRYGEAAADLEQAVALKPSGYRAYVNLALLRKRQEKFVEALAELDRATHLDPPPQILMNLQAERAHLLLLAKRYRDAAAACGALVETHPDLADAHGVLALALLELGDFERASRSFTRYLETGGKPTPDVYRGRGHARMKLGDFPGSADDYTRAMHARLDWDVLAHRGWAYYFADAPRLALHDFEGSLGLNQLNADAHVGRGLALVALGRYREAVMDAEEASLRPPETPEMMHNVACIFAQAVGRAEADREESDRAVLVAHYRERALASIRQALDRLPVAERSAFWRDKVLPDHALDPIRQSPEFLDLKAQMEETPPRLAP